MGGLPLLFSGVEQVKPSFQLHEQLTCSREGWIGKNESVYKLGICGEPNEEMMRRNKQSGGR